MKKLPVKYRLWLKWGHQLIRYTVLYGDNKFSLQLQTVNSLGVTDLAKLIWEPICSMVWMWFYLKRIRFSLNLISLAEFTSEKKRPDKIRSDQAWFNISSLDIFHFSSLDQDINQCPFIPSFNSNVITFKYGMLGLWILWSVLETNDFKVISLNCLLMAFSFNPILSPWAKTSVFICFPQINIWA